MKVRRYGQISKRKTRELDNTYLNYIAYIFVFPFVIAYLLVKWMIYKPVNWIYRRLKKND